MTGTRERLAAGLTAAAVFILDQGSKAAVRSSLALGETKPVLGDLVRFTHIMNPQGLMGLSFGQAGRFLLLPLSVMATAAVIYLFLRWQRAGALASAGLGLILAGAAGNISDRIRFGAVVDFIDCDIPDISIAPFRAGFINFPGFHLDRWYTFNVADSAVLAGVAVLIVLTLAGEKSRGETGDRASA